MGVKKNGKYIYVAYIFHWSHFWGNSLNLVTLLTTCVSAVSQQCLSTKYFVLFANKYLAVLGENVVLPGSVAYVSRCNGLTTELADTISETTNVSAY